MNNLEKQLPHCQIEAYGRDQAEPIWGDSTQI